MNKRTKPSSMNPGVALVRFQLMEILMRLAFKRYEDSNIIINNIYFIAKETNNKAEAVKMMFEKNLLPNFSNHNL